MSERTFLSSANLSKPEITCYLYLNVKCRLYTLHTQENFTISSNLLKFLNFLWLSAYFDFKNGIKGFSNFKCSKTKFYKTVRNICTIKCNLWYGPQKLVMKLNFSNKVRKVSKCIWTIQFLDYTNQTSWKGCKKLVLPSKILDCGYKNSKYEVWAQHLPYKWTKS